MRKVYQQQTGIGGLMFAVIGAAVLTAMVFGFLPFAHRVAHPSSTMQLQKAGTYTPPPPEEDSTPPPPPVQEEQKPPEAAPEPQLVDTPQRINLNASLDAVMGSGGSLSSLAPPISSQDLTQQTKQESMAAFDVTELDKAPEVIAAISPLYPSDMRKARVEGRVTILFVLTEDGRVEDPRVENASRPEFEKPALEAVRKWKFRPGSRAGEAVRTYMKLPIAFRIST